MQDDALDILLKTATSMLNFNAFLNKTTQLSTDNFQNEIIQQFNNSKQLTTTQQTCLNQQLY